MKKAQEQRDSNEKKKAIDTYSRIISKNPDYVEARWERASIYLNKKKYALSIPDYKQIIKLAPDSQYAALSSHSIGWIFALKGKYDEAADYSKKAYYSIGFWGSALNLGHIELFRGNEDQAKDWYNTSLSGFMSSGDLGIENEFLNSYVSDFNLFIKTGRNEKISQKYLTWIKKEFIRLLAEKYWQRQKST
ncbi:MAG: tetratricopeptide repeat protein, partial [Deltaproteobacteria bacterium]|nr:tetratricopeptide repeat protein [Deltaproteobacteria bacterium]